MAALPACLPACESINQSITFIVHGEPAGVSWECVSWECVSWECESVPNLLGISKLPKHLLLGCHGYIYNCTAIWVAGQQARPYTHKYHTRTPSSSCKYAQRFCHSRAVAATQSLLRLLRHPTHNQASRTHAPALCTRGASAAQHARAWSHVCVARGRVAGAAGVAPPLLLRRVLRQGEGRWSLGRVCLKAGGHPCGRGCFLPALQPARGAPEECASVHALRMGSLTPHPPVPHPTSPHPTPPHPTPPACVVRKPRSTPTPSRPGRPPGPARWCG